MATRLTDDQYALLVYLQNMYEVDDEEYWELSRPLWGTADQLDLQGLIESSIQGGFRITSAGLIALGARS